MPFRFDDLICPDCYTALQCNVKDGRGTLTCLAGHGPWLAEDGIARFIEGDVPHDNRWTATYREWDGWGPWGWLLRRNSPWGIPHLLQPMLARLGRYPLEILGSGVRRRLGVLDGVWACDGSGSWHPRASSGSVDI